MEGKTSSPPDPLPPTPPAHPLPHSLPLPQSMDATEMSLGPCLEVMESGSGTIVGGAPRQSAELEPLPCVVLAPCIVPADCISLGPYIAESGGLGGGSATVLCSPCLPAMSVQEPSLMPELDRLQRVFAILGSEVRWLGQKKISGLYGRLELKRRLAFQFVCQGIDWDSIQVEQRWEEE
jgi:hypothetical protein